MKEYRNLVTTVIKESKNYIEGCELLETHKDGKWKKGTTLIMEDWILSEFKDTMKAYFC